ncbi:outer membrane lipoprotein-sorting protein [Rhodoferax ferrireducens]|uniref:Outer membrane lipoprotein-sorting protein n=1 Tax=Rhodoferax ferrireducens TaxID=192843 RepID=A0ABU2CA68_9BURK|nr:outer membrane lipoprotein carrier protein LolA [Rhodoferax ferrireducens]MDR7378231.1 outer membrane lipoprotein-sorting protein [Rhodoferax ferrireducens]
MLRRQLLALAGLGALPWAPAAVAADIAAQVRQRLQDTELLRGEFEQSKTLKGFKKPLVSRGQFLVARGKGVQWLTREPFASTLVVTEERLVARQADGRISAQLNTRDEPGLRVVNSVMFALLRGDVAALSVRFSVDGELLGKDAWRLRLVPREAALLQVFTQVDIDGDQFVRSIKMAEVQGDSTVIRFTAMVPGVALSRDEEVRFE